MPERLVRVEWWDHTGSDGNWHSYGRAETRQPTRNVTVGKWINSDRRCIRIGCTWSIDGADDQAFTHAVCIVKGAVVSIRRLSLSPPKKSKRPKKK